MKNANDIQNPRNTNVNADVSSTNTAATAKYVLKSQEITMIMIIQGLPRVALWRFTRIPKSRPLKSVDSQILDSAAFKSSFVDVRIQVLLYFLNPRDETSYSAHMGGAALGAVLFPGF